MMPAVARQDSVDIATVIVMGSDADSMRYYCHFAAARMVDLASVGLHDFVDHWDLSFIFIAGL
jgi:hypothetical protein